MAKLTLNERLRLNIEEQSAWVKACGDSEAGYIERYGSKNDAKHFGDGGELIFAADIAALQALMNRAYDRHLFRRPGTV